ncbi:MAG: hypothetical protein RL095_1705 [Verrucomicrobiota bacterium]
MKKWIVCTAPSLALLGLIASALHQHGEAVSGIGGAAAKIPSVDGISKERASAPAMRRAAFKSEPLLVDDPLLGGEAAAPISGLPADRLVLMDDLPESRFKEDMKALEPAVRGRALQWLAGFNFDANEADELHVDPRSGSIHVACKFHGDEGDLACACGEAEEHAAGSGGARALFAMAEGSGSTAVISPITGPLPVLTPPVFHSKPGASKVIFLDFNGGSVSGTTWNSYYGVASYNCYPFSTDTDFTSFSTAEQTTMKQIWERVAEDYAAFDVDVTTENPSATQWATNKTAWAMITRSPDINGNALPFGAGGGVATLNTFGSSSYAYNSPAWVNQKSTNSFNNTAAAASHEVGHNLGLSHDTTKSNLGGYYGGHAALAGVAPSWAPIMGTAYTKNVSQFSKGEYYNANNKEDDLAILAAKLAYRADDYGSTLATASPLPKSTATSVAGSGYIERSTDVDVFSFSASAAGSVTLSASPYKCAAGPWSGNLDLQLVLKNAAGTVLASDNKPDVCDASITFALPAAGTYYLEVRPVAVGSPLNTTPSGYTLYGGVGQYTLGGSVP